MDRLPLADHTQLYRAIGQELSQTMGGSSGVLLAIFFAAAGDAASSGLTMRDALAGRARPAAGDRRRAARRPDDGRRPARRRSRRSSDGPRPGRRGRPRGAPTATADIVRARAGRAAYLSAEQIRGHVDPGAEAVARLFERLCDAGPVA